MSNSRPSSSYSALPPPAHSLHSCTSSGCALPPVPLPLVLDIAPDLTLVKSTSDPYLSCSDLVPLSLLFLRRPCSPSSPFPLLLQFIFLYLVYFPVCFCVKSGSTPVRGPVKSGQKRMKDKGKGAGQGVSPAGVGDRLDSMTKDNKR